MDRLKKAFTLSELLVVLAIVAILAAILFPVFRSARGAAFKTVCISNFKQTQFAAVMYLEDYNDTFMLVNYDIQHLNNPERDRTWVQLLMPYTKGLGTFVCPSDYGSRPRSGSFDPDLVVGDPYKRFYAESLRSNVGYNYLYYSPVYRQNGRWIVQPRTMSEIADTSEAIMFVDSVYERTPSGMPNGGGSYIVIPPCRFGRVGINLTDTFNVNSAPIYSPNQGWNVSNPNSSFRYGLAWPWHSDRINVGRVNGSAATLDPRRLGDGCQVLDNWSGYVTDFTKYAWDGN